MTYRSSFASGLIVLALALPVAASAQHGGRLDVPEIPANLTEYMTRRALAVRERILPAGHWRIAEAQALLGASLAAQRRTDEADRLMTAADRGLKPIPGRQLRDRELNGERHQRLRDAR